MTSNIDIDNYTAEELDKTKLTSLIERKKSFKIVAVKDISTIVNKVEGEIEKQKLRCRVYTEYRSTAMAAAAIPTGVTQITGLASALGIGVHNLFTFNPDYEIAKNQLNGTVTVLYKRD